MPQIIIANLANKTISFQKREQVLKILQQNFVDWMHACGGKGRCTTCKMKVVSGMENLTAPSPFEKKCKEKGLLEEENRLACQCVAEGNIIIQVPKENQLPHMDYSN